MTADLRQRIKAFLSRKSVLTINMVLLLFVGWGVAGEFSHNSALAEEIGRLQARAEDVQGKNLQLARLSEQLASGALVEREARVTLGLQKEGESVVVIQDDGQHTGTTATPVAVATTSTSNAAKWMSYFFHRVKP